MNDIKNGKFEVVVKPNCHKTEIVSEECGVLRVNVNARPEKGAANKELVKFLRKKFKKEVRIISGLTSHKKVVEVF